MTIDWHVHQSYLYHFDESCIVRELAALMQNLAGQERDRIMIKVLGANNATVSTRCSISQSKSDR
jgi:hypothetical protein